MNYASCSNRTRAESGRLSSSRLVESPASAVPLGTPTGGVNSLKGVGARPNFLRGQAKKWRGLAKGAQPSWLRSLLTFCRITESKCLPGMRAAKKRVSTGNRSSQRRVWEATSGAAAGELRPYGSREPLSPRARKRFSLLMVRRRPQRCRVPEPARAKPSLPRWRPSPGVAPGRATCGARLLRSFPLPGGNATENRAHRAFC